MLQVLQSKAPGVWSLKMPSHCVYLDTLLEVFPDARLVWAHRDPFTTLGSFCNLLHFPASMALHPEAVDKAAIGRNCAAARGAHRTPVAHASASATTGSSTCTTPT